MRRKLIFSILAVVLLAGCTREIPGVKVVEPSVEIGSLPTGTVAYMMSIRVTREGAYWQLTNSEVVRYCDTMYNVAVWHTEAEGWHFKNCSYIARITAFRENPDPIMTRPTSVIWLKRVR